MARLDLRDSGGCASIILKCIPYFGKRDGTT